MSSNMNSSTSALYTCGRGCNEPVGDGYESPMDLRMHNCDFCPQIENQLKAADGNTRINYAMGRTVNSQLNDSQMHNIQPVEETVSSVATDNDVDMNVSLQCDLQSDAVDLTVVWTD